MGLGKTYYHRQQVLSEINDTFFKVTTNIPVGEKILEALSSGHGDIDLIIPSLHKMNGQKILQEKWELSK